MKKKIIGIFVMMLLIMTVVLPLSKTIDVCDANKIIIKKTGDYFPAATDADIQKAIADGIAWLVSQQNLDGTPETNPYYGSWGPYGGTPTYPPHSSTAITALVLIKLQDYAYELGYSPWALDYMYSNAVYWGWWYLFTPIIEENRLWPPDNGIYMRKQPIGIQLHTDVNTQTVFRDNPDTNGNGIGIYLGAGDETPSEPYTGRLYHTGILLSALVAIGNPDNRNFRFIDYNGDGIEDSYKEIAQDVVDWIAFAQSDAENQYSGGKRGGFHYYGWDNEDGWADNSVSGYACQGLAAAEAITPRPGAKAFACTIPAWVKRELNYWIDYIQNNGGSPYQGGDGGSWYETQKDDGPNQLRTGNLIFEMRFYGDNPKGGTGTRFDRALNFIERYWREPNANLGWGFNTDPADYQAMFCLMKGLLYSDNLKIDTSGTGTGPRNDNWYNVESSTTPYPDFASVLVAQQDKTTTNFIGSWPRCHHSDIGRNLSTTWALLTLEKVVPLCGNLSINKEAPLTSYQGDTITYTINFANPTDDTVHNVYIIDYIPSGTTFKRVSPGGVPPPPYVYWYIGNLLPGDIGSVWFEVTVDYGDPIDSIRNDVYIYSDDTLPVMASAETYLLYQDPPPDNPDIEGPTDGTVGVEHDYSIVSTNPDGDRIFYFYDWDDGTPMACIGPCESGEEALVNHTWEEPGTYTIKAMAVNEYNAKSDWTTMDVTMPRNRAIDTPFLQFLEQYPILYQLLQRFLRL